MKLGLGLYHHMLTEREFAFARQCGCTDLIVHLANYYDGDKNIVMATDETKNYGTAKAMDPIWSGKTFVCFRNRRRRRDFKSMGLRTSVLPTGMTFCLMDPKRKNKWKI